LLCGLEKETSYERNNPIFCPCDLRGGASAGTRIDLARIEDIGAIAWDELSSPSVSEVWTAEQFNHF
jgi:hypothetical protein